MLSFDKLPNPGLRICWNYPLVFQIHESGERKIGLNEKPLLVQLSWHHDDREGRFLLRRIDEVSLIPKPTQEDSSFKRKLSKREKKEQKKQEKKDKAKDGKADESMADKLYTGRNRTIECEGWRRHSSLILILLFTKPNIEVSGWLHQTKTNFTHIVYQPFSRVSPPSFTLYD